MILLILADLDNAIAKDGKQITFIPEDLARFKARTTGEVILMGRKTLENAGKLPHRITGVMTRKNLPDEEDLFYFSSEKELEEKLKAYGDKKSTSSAAPGSSKPSFTASRRPTLPGSTTDPAAR